MELLKIEYNSRLNEFEELLKFLELIEENNLYNSNSEKIIINSSIINSTKSSLILIIYNLIEYTILNSVEIIERDFKNQSFEDFIDEFQSLFLKIFWIYLNEFTHNTIKKKINEENLIWGMLDSIIEHWYFNENIDLNKKCKIKVANKNWNYKWINGNISYKTIEVLSSFFDFKKIFTKEINSKVDLLEDIRNKRNNLAHGNVSFNFLWKDLTTTQLFNYKKNISRFLDIYITIIEKYIIDKPYLKV